jgi:Na+-driven multidrug efflux pump
MEEQFADQQVRNIVRRTMIPNFTAELSLSATSIVDGIVVGNFYGAQGLAAVGLGAPILSVFTILAGLLGTGNSVLCSRILGQSSKERANRIFSLSILWALIFSVVFTALTIGGSGIIAQLFSGTGSKAVLSDVRNYIIGFSLGAPFIIFRQLFIPMVNIEGGNKMIHISSFLILFTDALLDFVFSAWLDGGTFGLGAASALSYICGCLPLFFFFLKNKGLSPSLRIKFSWSESFDIFKAGMPTAVKRICNVIAPVLTNRFMLFVGSVGAMASLSVMTSSTKLLLCLVLALSTTVLLISSSFYGEQDKHQMISGMRELTRQSMLWSIVLSVIFIIFARPFALCFIRDNQDVLSQSIFAIRCYALGIPFMAINQCAASYLQATKRLKASNYVIVADRLLYIVVFVYLLGSLFGTKGIFMAYAASEMFLSLTLYIILCIKGKTFITSFEKLMNLPDDFGVPEDRCIFGDVRTIEDICNFSRNVQNFCSRQKIDGHRAFAVALCIDELARICQNYSLAEKGKSQAIRVFINSRDKVVIRLRDEGKPFNMDQRESLEIIDENDITSQIGIRLAFGMAETISYNAMYGMNNITIIV